MSAIAPPQAPRRGLRPRNPFRRRSPLDMHPLAKFGAFCLLCGWALVVLLPIYWLVVTSFKTPYQVDKGPFYIPFVDFQPTLDPWHYILVELGNDTLRPYINTVIVGLSSARHRADPRVDCRVCPRALPVQPALGDHRAVHRVHRVHLGRHRVGCSIGDRRRLRARRSS